MDQSEKRRITEALILGSADPITAQRIAEIIPYCKPRQVGALVEELNAAQGQAVDVGGYFQPNDDKAEAAMRPSATLNAALAALG